MTKQRKAQIITLLLMAGIGAVVYFRQNAPSAPQQKPDPTPQDAIYAMLDAAREGNVKTYLTWFTGQMETSLKQTISEQGEGAFSKYLKETNAPIKGIAITEPQPLTDREVKVKVEYVYQDRNEIQYYYLERAGREWRIARLDAAERVKTLVPYGTPVQ